MLKKHKVWAIKLIPNFLMNFAKLVEEKIEERAEGFLETEAIRHST